MSNQNNTSQLKVEDLETCKNIPKWFWERIKCTNNDNWNDMLEKVIGFRNEHGRLPSEVSNNEDEHSLGKWLNCQRKCCYFSK